MEPLYIYLVWGTLEMKKPGNAINWVSNETRTEKLRVVLAVLRKPMKLPKFNIFTGRFEPNRYDPNPVGTMQ